MKNFVDSPIIVDAENGLFYKQVRLFSHVDCIMKLFLPSCNVLS